MAEPRGPIAAGNKLAMSRALGAAFLTHQVEQLEKTVSAGPGSRNWRERKAFPNSNVPNGRPNGGKRSPAQFGAKYPKRRDVVEGAPVEGKEIQIKKRDEEQRELRKEQRKDADIVVLDASVLVHALSQVKKWCRDGREEILIVPLEALNTLDLLKKGTSNLAQRARAASRILEAQVGTNKRIRVQRDSAFVLWDSIDFQASGPEDPSTHLGSPEWLRRTICCAQWAVENPDAELLESTADAQPTHIVEAQQDSPKRRVVLAILSQTALAPPSPPKNTTGLADSPVPLPAPHASKHEPRSSGQLVMQWAKRAGIDIFEANAAPVPEPTGRSSEEED
ncbi:hypothetical protein EWM64_g2720, partial [Hericium alpestre]